MTRHCKQFLAEYESAHVLAGAARIVRERGLSDIESYSPQPLEDEETSTPIRPRAIAACAFLGASLFAALGYYLQYYSAVVDYPVNVGGRPSDSAIAFVPATLELAILGAALGIIISFLWTSDLPRFHRTLFDVDGFSRATGDRFFLLVGVKAESHGDMQATRKLIESTGTLSLRELEDDGS